MSKIRDGRHRRGLTVFVKNDDYGRALRSLSKKVQESGLIQDIKDRMFYDPPSVTRQLSRKKAIKRWERKLDLMDPK